MPPEDFIHTDFDARLQDPAASFVRESCAGARAVMIAFGGIKLKLGIPTFEFFQLARGISAHKLFFRDVHQAWYHRGLPGVGSCIQEMAAFIQSEISSMGATRIALFGNSMGGYAALLFGALVDADEVHVFAPQTFLSPWSLLRHGDFRWKRDIWRVYFSKDRRVHLDLRKTLLAAKRTEFHIHFSALNRLDTVHARHLEGIANVHLHDHPEGGHRVVKTLRDNGTLRQIVQRALAEPGEVAPRRAECGLSRTRQVAIDGRSPETKFMKQGYVLLAGIFCVTGVHAANWPQWRGPNFDGSTTESGLPAQFSKTENVAWVAPMTGPSGSTPVIFGDQIFLNSIDAAKKTRVALCLDRKTGKAVWQNEVGPGIAYDDKSNFSSPSPVTDGQLVYFYYGDGELVCFDVAGKKVWSRNIQKDYGPFSYQWTYSASPTLSDGKLYVQVLQRNAPVHGRGKDGAESFLLALDPKTGKEIWKHVRPSDAVQESLEAFSTPVPFTHNGRKELLIVGGDCITGHDPVSGKELWRWGTWNPQKIGHWRLVPSPVAGGGVVLACGPKNAPVFAVKLGGNGKLDNSSIAWESADRDVTSDVPTPVFYKGKFYILNGGKRKLLCVEPANGKVVWSGDLESRSVFEASPTAADDKIYVMDHRGNVFVVAANTDQFKLLGSAAMGEEGDNYLRSSVAISQGQIFVRNGKNLYCIGKK